MPECLAQLDTPVADVSRAVVFATWCGTGCLVEPNYHAGVSTTRHEGRSGALKRVRILSSADFHNFCSGGFLGSSTSPGGGGLPVCSALCGVVNSVCYAGRDPFVSVADVLGIVGFATWRGTEWLFEPNCHGGARYCPRPHPQVHVLQRPTCPTRLRHGAGGRLRQGVGGTARRELRAQVLICVACMVRPR